MPRKSNSSKDSAGLTLVDGALSTPRVEMYALMIAEGVLSQYQCFVVTHRSNGGTLPSGKRKQNIESSPLFKARVEELMAEKAELEEGGIWGQLEWQARQNYRRAVAMNDLARQLAATNQLMQIALKGGKAPKVEVAENDDAEPEVKRGRGAPTIEAPMPGDGQPNYRASVLLDKR